MQRHPPAWLRLTIAMVLTCCAAVLLALRSTSPVEVYDFVIVGGGSTGSVVAARLGDAGYTVLVLEAGGPTQQSLGGTKTVAGRWTIFDVPLGWVQVLSDHRWSKQFQWDVPADPPPAVARGLGGCGIHNAMVYIRGRPGDFASWGRGWSWDEVLPYYRRSESNQQHGDDSRLHGVDGPVSVSSVESDNISRAFVASAVSAGLPHNPDFNGESRDGVGDYQFMIRDGVRASAAAAFIGDGRRPPTVTVRTHSAVSQAPRPHASLRASLDACTNLPPLSPSPSPSTSVSPAPPSSSSPSPQLRFSSTSTRERRASSTCAGRTRQTVRPACA